MNNILLSLVIFPINKKDMFWGFLFKRFNYDSYAKPYLSQYTE